MRTFRLRAWAAAWAFCLAPLLVIAVPGCQTMTAGQALKRSTELKTELEQELAAVKSRREEEQRKADEAGQKAMRENARIKAAGFLSQGEARRALEEIEKIYHPPPEPRKDPTTGVEELKPVDPPVLEPAEDAQLLVLKAAALYNLDPPKKEDAIAAFRSALERDPSLRVARRNLGKVLFIEKRYAEALQAFGPELVDGYRDAELLNLAGQAHYEVGKAEGSLAEIEAARLAFQGALVERSGDPELRRWMATLEYETGRYAEAVRYLEAIRKDNPLDPDYLEMLGNCHLKLNDRARALDFLELAYSMKAPGPEGARTLAQLYQERGVSGRAADWLLRAYHDDPREAPPDERYRLGALLFEAGRGDEATAWLGALGERDPRYAEAQSTLARFYQEAGKPDEALAAYEGIKKTRPQDGAAHLAAARIYFERKQWGPAVEGFARASALPGTQVEGLSGLAEVAYARANLEAALRYARKALEARAGDARLKAVVRQLELELRSRRDKDGAAGAPRPAEQG